MENFKCIQCGSCCRQYSIPIFYSDITRWSDEDRLDILREVVFCRGAPKGDGFYFESTVTAPKKPCIFLKNNLCSIHDTKPMCCKDAPESFEEFDCCPVWNKKFINKDKRENVVARQDRDSKECVNNFEQLLKITFRARGFNNLEVSIK